MANASADQVDRINRTISYIDDHLGDQLDLDALAAIACFSKFHFHRVFKQVAGVSPQEYVKRRRLEMAHHFLSNDSNLSVNEIADLLGFSSPSNFARSFKERFQFAPSRLRSPDFQAPGRTASEPARPLAIIDPALVRLEAVEPFTVLYRRAKGNPVDVGMVEATFAALHMECARQGWTKEGGREVVIGKSIPGLSDPARSLFDFGVEVQATVQPRDAAHVQVVPGGNYARYDFRGDPVRVVDCWSELYSVWLKRSGLSVGAGFGFTVNASERTRGAFLLYQPVRPGGGRRRR
jgi:AraC family transcriptional regulator